MSWIRIGIKTPEKYEREEKSHDSRGSSKGKYQKFVANGQLKMSASRKSLGVLAVTSRSRIEENINASREGDVSFLIKSPVKCEPAQSPITPIKSGGSQSKFKRALQQMRVKMLRSSIEPELHRLKKLCGQIRNILHMTLIKINEFCKDAMVKTVEFAKRTAYEIENHMKVMEDTGNHIQKMHDQLSTKQPNLKLNLASLDLSKKPSAPVTMNEIVQDKPDSNRSETQGQRRNRLNKSSSQCMQITEAIKRMKGILGPRRYDL